MVIKNEIYIVYRQNMEGINISPHYFLNKHHACKYAVVTKGKIAYGMPEVHKVTTVYNTENLDVNTYTDNVTILSEEEIQQCAKDVIQPDKQPNISYDDIKEKLLSGAQDLAKEICEIICPEIDHEEDETACGLIREYIKNQIEALK